MAAAVARDQTQPEATVGLAAARLRALAGRLALLELELLDKVTTAASAVGLLRSVRVAVAVRAQ